MIKLELPKLSSNRIVEGKKTMTKENDIYNPNKKPQKSCVGKFVTPTEDTSIGIPQPHHYSILF